MWVCVFFWMGSVSCMCLCVHVCVYACNRVPGLQLCLAVGGLQRDQDQQGEEETDRLHSGSGTAQGSVLLSRELSTPLINLSEDTASGEKSFIPGFLVKIQKMLHPFYLTKMLGWTGICYLPPAPDAITSWSPDDLNRCLCAAFQSTKLSRVSRGSEQSESETCLVDISQKTKKQNKKITPQHEK